MPSDAPRRSPSDTVANGPAIRAIREARGVRLGILARDCAVSSSYLSNIEAGRKNASPALLRKIADRLQCPLDAIALLRPGRAA